MRKQDTNWVHQRGDGKTHPPWTYDKWEQSNMESYVRQKRNSPYAAPQTVKKRRNKGIKRVIWQCGQKAFHVSWPISFVLLLCLYIVL
jgi:hypothetical protein